MSGAYIEPGKLWQNGFAESFVSRLRDEFLDGEVLWSVRDAQTRLSGWRRYYNEERLHSRIGYKTPAEFASAWRGGGRKRQQNRARLRQPLVHKEGADHFQIN